MSYNNLLDHQLTSAFRMLKDLAVDAQYTKSSSSGFDFGTGSSTVVPSAPIAIKLVVTETVKKEKNVIKTVLARAADIDVLNEYCIFSFENSNWKIQEVLRQSGRVWMFSLAKVVS